MFDVYTVDELFAAGGLWGGKRLGFAHWDVEGSELEVLRGAVGVIRRDWPLFSVEVVIRQPTPRVRSSASLESDMSAPAKDMRVRDGTREFELMKLIRSLGSELYEIQEDCGVSDSGGWWNCRNFLCAPRALVPKLTCSRVVRSLTQQGRLRLVGRLLAHPTEQALADLADKTLKGHARPLPHGWCGPSMSHSAWRIVNTTRDK